MESSRRVEALDSSVLLRALVGDAPEQAAWARTLIEDEGRKFLIADVAFFEVVYTLQKFYGWPRRTIAAVLAGALIDRGNIECNRCLIYQVLDDYVTHPKLSFADCYLAWRARMSEATPLWTFDRKLARQMVPARLLAVKVRVSVDFRSLRAR